jgi:hypothetical protein
MTDMPEVSWPEVGFWEIGWATVAGLVYILGAFSS